MDFTPNQFILFKATREFRIADPTATTGQGKTLTIYKDSTVEFDGNQLKWGTQLFMMPSIKGALRDGWLVPADGSVYTAPTPSVASAPAAPQEGTTTEELATVGKVKTSKKAASATVEIDEAQTVTRPKYKHKLVTNPQL